MVQRVVPRVIGPVAHRVVVIVIHSVRDPKNSRSAVDNRPGRGIECDVLFSMYSGKGGDVSEELWHRCLTRLEDELPSQQFNMWIRPLQVTASADGGELTLFAPNRFVVDWVRDKYLERIGEVLGELQSGPLPQLRLEVGSSRAPAAPARAPGPAPAERRAPQAVSEPRAKAVSPELGGAAKHRSNLNSSFTFVTFSDTSYREDSTVW